MEEGNQEASSRCICLPANDIKLGDKKGDSERGKRIV